MRNKNNKKIKERAKQIMAITSRLMQISLIVDKYIYKNQPISLQQAEKFLEEVTCLKMKCMEDERSLQVIEKLKGYMNHIIKEQTLCDTSFITKDCTTDSVENNNVRMRQKTNIYDKDSDQNNVHKTVSKIKRISLDTVSSIEVAVVQCNESSNQELVRNPNGKSIQDIETIVEDNIQHNGQTVHQTHTQNSIQDNNDTLTLNNTNTSKESETYSTIIDNESIKTNKTKERETAFHIKSKNIQDAKKHKSNNINGTADKIKKRTRFTSKIDLSWINKIKFVREACTDEHIDLPITDNFWTDFSLPFHDFDD